MIDETKDRSVKVYFGVGASSFPTRRPDAVIEEFGAEQGAMLVEYVESIIRETTNYHPGADLAAAQLKLQDGLRSSHGELSEDAIRAVGRWYSYSWR